MDIEVRKLESADAAIISKAFKEMGWNKPVSQYSRYYEQQVRGEREVLLATLSGQFAAYLTILWQSQYQPFLKSGIPEIQDLNVLQKFRQRGIASRLMDDAEAIVASRHTEIGIGVGLHPGYNAAQRLYVKRGYVPDGYGVTYSYLPVSEGSQVLLDDELVLWFTKSLGSKQERVSQ